MASCVVSYLDSEGVRHTVEVEASGLFEAATLAIRTFRQHNCGPGPASRLEVEVRSSVTHTVTAQKVQDWLTGGARNPKEKILKDRLRSILASD
jgi:hypothetical protein